MLVALAVLLLVGCATSEGSEIEVGATERTSSNVLATPGSTLAPLAAALESDTDPPASAAQPVAPGEVESPTWTLDWKPTGAALGVGFYGAHSPASGCDPMPSTQVRTLDEALEWRVVGEVPGSEVAGIDFRSPNVGYVISGCGDRFFVNAATFIEDRLMLVGTASELASVPSAFGWHTAVDVRIGDEIFSTVTGVLSAATGTVLSRGQPLGVSADGQFRYFRSSKTPYCETVPPARHDEKLNAVESVDDSGAPPASFFAADGANRIVFGPDGLVAWITDQQPCASALFGVSRINSDSGLPDEQTIAWERFLGPEFGWTVEDEYGYRTVPDGFVFTDDGAIWAWQLHPDGSITSQTRTLEELQAALPPGGG